jgi:tRNA modification GTPase
MNPNDTIFAVASGAGRAALSVIRISGPQTRFVFETMVGDVPAERRLVLRKLRDQAGELLDQALVAWMPGPNSFTGEDTGEFHIHGGAAVRSAVVRSLSQVPGCRPAEPGEFTRRAFLNQRMDLTEVEGLADLINAETEAQRRQAVRQLEGVLGNLVEGWREELLQASALLEAALDFSDEGDVPVGLEASASEIADRVRRAVILHLEEGGRGERLREGFTVVLAGPPNAGKSSLINTLAKRDVAIVSEVAGTTRDAIEVHCDLGGLPVTFVDTAGIRDTNDPVEKMGVARSKAHLGRADLVLWLDAPDVPEGEAPSTPEILRVATKADLGAKEGDLRISARTGTGIDDLLEVIRLRAEISMGAGDALLTRERYRTALERAAKSLQRVEQALEGGQTELAAEDVRLALRDVGTITGRVDVEHVLDRLFASFCIGK